MLKVSALALSALLAVTVAASAGTNVRTNSASQSISGSRSVANGGSNRNTINIGNGGGGSGLGLYAPSVSGPSLATGGSDTCLGVISLGLSGPGGGLSFGQSTEDRPCNARKDAILLTALGQKKAALQALCTDKAMFATLAAAGVHCKINPELSAVSATQAAPTYFNPFNRNGR